MKAMHICSFFTTQQRYKHIPVHLCQEEGQVLALVDLALIEQALERNEQNELQFLQQVLSTAEQEYFQRFKYMKRKKEWLGGRIAAKAALLALVNADPPNLPHITLLPNKHGRPIIKEVSKSLNNASSLKSNTALSISHSDGFAVALARHSRTCGIDLQEVSTKLAGLTSHFATDAELLLLAEQAGCDEDTRLTMLWTVKEALKKALLHDQAVIFSETELYELTRLNQSVNEEVWRFICTVQEKRQAVLVHLLPPYVLSLTDNH
jgi:phosphopantetheinyl transferase